MSLVAASSVLDGNFDVVIFINDAIRSLGSDLAPIEDALTAYEKINPKLSTTLDIMAFPAHSCCRLIFSPTGKLDGDTDDSRNVYDAAVAGLKKAVAIDCKQPLLVLGPIASAANSDAPWVEGEFPLLNVALGALHALYQPLEVREAFHARQTKYTKLGIYGASDELLTIAWAIEEGRRVARDIGGSDPERMSASRIVEYLRKEFQGSPDVAIDVSGVDSSVYPLMAAVDRSTCGVDRHRGQVVHMTYRGGGADTSLFLVGKGITFDTGGSDVKANGLMAGMHRDKCGAAAVAGFMRTLALLRPMGLHVVAHLAFVRNGIGPESFVADEIITSRAGKRVRIGNTDAEGRMIMSDLLCLAKEEAESSVNPFLFTVATLTGHAIRAYKFYTAIMDNGPARKFGMAHKLQKAGERISDMAEVSTIRKEDYDANKGHTEYEDLLQCNNLPSSATPRGHQLPAAFMVMASGLEKHGLGCEKQLPYTHMDVAGSAGLIDILPTAAPLMMLTSMFVLPRVWTTAAAEVTD